MQKGNLLQKTTSGFRRANTQDRVRNVMAMSETLIDADIRKARTLPSRFYTEPIEFERLKTVFNGWQFAAHTSELETHTMLPLPHIQDITGESVLLLRDQETRSLSNVCNCELASVISFFTSSFRSAPNVSVNIFVLRRLHADNNSSI